jgi:hypothetical protein
VLWRAQALSLFELRRQECRRCNANSFCLDGLVGTVLICIAGVIAALTGSRFAVPVALIKNTRHCSSRRGMQQRQYEAMPAFQISSGCATVFTQDVPLQSVFQHRVIG